VTEDEIPLELDDELRAAVDGAFAGGNHITVGYVGDDGWPHLSRRGTTQVFGPRELAIWVRKRDDGLAQAIAERPRVTLLFVDLSVPQLYTFYGHGRIVADDETAKRVYESSPEQEQAQDPERKGVPMIVDLERIVAQGTRNFVMRR
jgi:Pyridoxamine 5'-phosphate oxidase